MTCSTSPLTGTSTYAEKSRGGHVSCDPAPLTTSSGTVGQWDTVAGHWRAQDTFTLHSTPPRDRSTYTGSRYPPGRRVDLHLLLCTPLSATAVPSSRLRTTFFLRRQQALADDGHSLSSTGFPISITSTSGSRFIRDGDGAASSPLGLRGSL